MKPFKWTDPNEEEVIKILVEKNGFNIDRVKKQLDRLKKG